MRAAMFGWQARETALVERWIEDGDRIELGRRELAVIPGHGPTTRIGEEARANPFVRG